MSTTARTPGPRLAPPVPGGVLAAVSGGPDSTALAALLARDGSCRPLALGWVRHGFRPAAEAEEARGLAKLAARLDVPLHSVVLTPPPGWSSGRPIPEDHARRERYRALAALARSHGLRVVATAHHHEDQEETRLLALVRGGDLRALTGMRPVRSLEGDLLLWRPLLGEPRSALLQMLVDLGIEPQHDASNDDLRQRRNLWRHRVLPALREARDPLLARSDRLGELAVAALQRLHAALRCRWETLREPSVRSDTLLLPAGHVRRLSAALLHHGLEALHTAVLPEGPLPSLARRRSRELTAWLRRPAAQGALAMLDLVLERSGPWLAAFPAAGPLPFDRPLPRPGSSLSVPGASWSLHVHPTVPGVHPEGTPLRALPAALAAQLRVRSRLPGDRLLLPQGSRSLKQRFQDLQVPRCERNHWPVLAAGDRVLWAPGLDDSPLPPGGPGDLYLEVRGLPDARARQRNATR